MSQSKTLMKSMTGPDKAELLMRLLGAKNCEKTIGRLPQLQLEHLLDRLNTAPRAIPDRQAIWVLHEFAQLATRQVEPEDAEMDPNLNTQLEQVLMESNPSFEKKLFGFTKLEDLGADRVYTLIKNENSQVLVIILSRVSKVMANEVLALMPPKQRCEVMISMGRSPSVPVERVEQVNQFIESQIDHLKTLKSYDGASEVAELLETLPEESMDTEIEAIAAADPDLAELVRSKILKFSDVMALPENNVRVVIDGLNAMTVGIALVNVSEEVKAKVLGVMTEGNRLIAQAELMSKKRRREADITAAQSEILKAAKRKEAEGRVDLR
ncbi:FliG C-terminal domain-containing protein [Ferrimonas marina]|uniref:Flagellar motor switch protein FliG n=1 Tax=Ferrimonas marina TaxID=299255 RepID=A0A1M5TEP4_9GAMM|nr:FliG C-terminal domain-containing protein [Ferrimonas marina]SHH49285.1 Flagellar motor switch protein FliG [Ferrimonas marina]